MTTTIEPPSTMTAPYPAPEPSGDDTLLTAIAGEATFFHYELGFPRFTKKLTAEELGLTPEHVNPAYINLGSKRLLAKQRDELEGFSKMESRIQAFIAERSFECLGRRGVPNTNLDEVIQGMMDFEKEWENSKIEFIIRYEGIKEAALEDWKSYIAEANDASLRKEGKLAIPHPAIFLQAIRDAFPRIDKLKFRFRYSATAINAVEGLTERLTSLSEQKEITEEKQKRAKEIAQRLSRELTEDLEKMVGALRTEAFSTVTNMIETMNSGKGPPIHQKTLNALRNYIDKFRKLNFVGDVKLDQMLDGFESEYLNMSAADYRKDEGALDSLKKALSNLSGGLHSLMDEEAKAVVSQFSLAGSSRRKVVID